MISNNSKYYNNKKSIITYFYLIIQIINLMWLSCLIIYVIYYAFKMECFCLCIGTMCLQM